ncbi:MAG TPA: hypothetical protein ENN64_00945 [bacterium]|nr:hypothetical protein [bacterium]
MGGNYYEDNTFHFRYQLNRRGPFKYLFVPRGPNCERTDDFEKFLKYIDSNFRLSRILIELPTIYNQDSVSVIDKLLIKNNYKRIPYRIHDPETLILFSKIKDYSKKTAYSVRYAEKRCRADTLRNPRKEELHEAYELYKKSSARINFKPKPFEAFEEISRNSILTRVYDKESSNLIAFILSYIREYDTENMFKNVKIDNCQAERPSEINFSKKVSKVAQTLFSGTDIQGRKKKAGYLARDNMIKYSFDELGVDLIDYRGGSRESNYKYTDFKIQFADIYYPLPGAYTKLKIL